MTQVVVFAFDPVPELGERTGILVCTAELAYQLVSEHRAERMGEHANDGLRYVAGSTAHAAAREALRCAKLGLNPPRPRRAKSEGVRR
jgi:hypothetical protein